MGGELEQLMLYTLFCGVADAQSEDARYEAVELLMDSGHYQDNPKFKLYFDTEWGTCQFKWSACYWTESFTRGYKTNNFTEALNKPIKAIFATRNDLRIDSMVVLSVTKVTPRYNDKHRKEQTLDLDPFVNHNVTYDSLFDGLPRKVSPIHFHFPFPFFFE